MAIFVAGTLTAEIRSVWVLPWDISSPEAIDEVVLSAIDNHQNELLAEVRYRSDALYDTSLGAGTYPNPEPRSYILKDNGFDPLKYLLDKAHQAGLQVQAWVIVFNATPLDNALIQQNYIYRNHRDWITQAENGNRFNGSRQFGYFLDPGVPEVQDYLLNVFSNLVSGYPELDGLHLDYIRYPEGNLGYHPVSVLRYQEYCRNQAEITFNEWRIMQVSGFVEKVHNRIKEIAPGLKLSAAVFSDIAEANVAYAQDWPDWLRRGIIDQVYPMAYNLKYESHKSQLERMKLLGKDEQIIIGHRAWDDKGRSLANLNGGYYNLRDLAKRIDLARELGFGGVAMFSYAGLKTGNAWPKLKEMSFPEPVPYPQTVMASLEQENTVFPKMETENEQNAVSAGIPAITDETAASADAIPEQTTTQSGFQADIRMEARLYRNGSHLQLRLTLPHEGYWNYSLYCDNLLSSGQKYFPQGDSQELLDLSLEHECPSNASKMVFQLSPDNSDFVYLIPVEIGQSDE